MRTSGNISSNTIIADRVSPARPAAATAGDRDRLSPTVAMPPARSARPSAWDHQWIKHPRTKRVIDLLGALCGLILLGPAFAFIAFLIKTTSPGPVFYRGIRAGRFAEPFRIFKFRTMVVDAEKLGGSTTGRNDSRVTRVGAVLRRFKIDELPQLINVLTGDISLVGPRPEVYEYTSKFTDEQQVILAIRPGITDLSSLHFIDLQAHVGECDPDEVFRTRILPVKNRLRMQYVHNQSVAGDIKILLSTVARLAIPAAIQRGARPAEHSTLAAPLPHVPSEPSPPIDRLRLGQSDLSITRCAMGCWAIGGHGWGQVADGDSIGAVHAALDAGINHFDTADVYGLGRSEELLARALGNRRHKMVIATKFGIRFDGTGNSTRDLSRAHTMRAVEASLRRLRIETIPLYYAHWPDGQTPIQELMETLLDLQRSGKIRCIGLSNFSVAQLREAVQVGTVDAIQLQHSLIEPDNLAPFLELLHEHRITAVTWGSLGRGILTGKFHAGSQFGEDDSRSRDAHFQGDQFTRNLATADRVRRVARDRRVPAAQVALRYAMDTPGAGCALFGAKTAEQVFENTGALRWTLTLQEYALLSGDRPSHDVHHPSVVPSGSSRAA